LFFVPQTWSQRLATYRPPMLNSPKVLALRETLARASSTISTAEYTTTDKALRDEVCDVVEELKRLGWPPERAIIAIKEIAEEAGLTQSRQVLLKNRDLDARDALLAKIVRWTIECYYDAPTKVA
jgi:hypothetical protein